MKPTSSFVGITSEGGLLPTDFLSELLAPKSTIEGLTPQCYGLAEGERVSEQVNRSWVRLKGRWTDFKKAIGGKQPGDPTTTATRDRWLHPIFQELGFGQRLAVAPPIEVDGRSYPVSHGWTHVPIHLVGSHVDLDRRTPGAVGAAKASPHSLVQQALNASQRHLWGIVTNGLTFRLLRDSIALTRLSYVEWDLAAIFDGDLYSEFFLLWLVCHQSRFEDDRANGGPPNACWLEQWKKSAEDKGLRALQKLRPGVARAIEALGAGLVSHPANKALCARLRGGDLSTQDFYRQVLRVIYRMLFLFVAEDRDLLHPPLPGPTASKEEVESAHRARHRYRNYYAITRLHGLTLHRAGTPHPDLWFIFQLLTKKLGSDTGCPELALPPLGSFLWDATRSTPDLAGTLVSNRHLLTAVHALAFVQDGSVRRPIDYKNLGSEELGSVYEGLLELHPLINADAGVFELNIAAGNERKTSGSYYTPDSLVQCLLDSALEPVMAEAVRGKQGQAAAEALLKLKVCDKAVGSGYFLIGAAHRLAKRVAAARSGEEEPSPEATRTALRDVIGRCLYGVDINPMSAELCRVNLWLEALEPGKPLSFLDHHIRCGNSLLGATAELIAGGLPDEAFNAIEGDDKTACASLKKLNRAQREGLRHLFMAEDTAIRERMHQAAAAIDEISDSRPEDIHRKEAAFRNAQQNYDFQKAWDLANLWCSAFVIKKQFSGGASEISKLQSQVASLPVPTTIQTGLFGGIDESPNAKTKKPKAPSRSSSDIPIGITTQHLRDFVEGGALPDGLLAETKRLAEQYQFFHYHLAFPEVFAQGGFDVNLGNPPWDVFQPEEEKYFAVYDPAILDGKTASERKRRIQNLKLGNSVVWQRWADTCDIILRSRFFMGVSGCFPLTSYGKTNLYSSFAEAALRLISKQGRIGIIVPTGIATDEPNKHFMQALFSGSRLLSLFDFENREGLFPSVDSRMKFCLLTMGASQSPSSGAKFAFYAHSVAQLAENGRIFTLTSDDISLLNPNTKTCPVFRGARDAELTKLFYRRVTAFQVEGKADGDPWTMRLARLFMMDSDSGCFVPIEEVSDDSLFRRLYESKLMHQFDHRFATFKEVGLNKLRGGQAEEVADKSPDNLIVPRFCVPPEITEARYQRSEWQNRWALSLRDITNVTNERTTITCVIPREAAANNLPLILSTQTAIEIGCLCANLNSLVLDYASRQKVGGTHINLYLLQQFPVLTPSAYAQACLWFCGKQTLREWLLPRVLELTYTAWDLEAFAQDCGWSGPPLRWDEERRFLLRCELDAAFFHHYLGSEDEWRKQPAALTQAFLTPRDAVSYIMDTFPIVKRKDEAKFNGDYRTKRTILEIYDALAESIQSGQPYETRLDPPPADPRCCHQTEST